MDENGIGFDENRPLRVAIIGSGPSGFYAAVALLKHDRFPVEVDLFDRLPTPYGLVRGGVAPDHQKIKAVTAVYDKTAAHPGFRFLGNVELGRDIQVLDLTEHYDQIVYAVGNEADRRMGIPGETLLGCTPATVFVGWYNAHPDYRDAAFDFSRTRVAVVGNGNVAIDVARILARSSSQLKSTDITDYALESLAESQVHEVLVIGRRGPVQAAFTPAELKELANIEGVDIIVDPVDLKLDDVSQKTLDESSANSPARKNYELLLALSKKERSGTRRSVRFQFLSSPVEVIGNRAGRAQKLLVEKNKLVPQESGYLSAVGTDEFEEIEIGWLFVSIGYQGQRLPNVPFDEKKGVIANVGGRVLYPDTGEILPNQYVVGWAKSGPQGLIGMHKGASAEVVKHMLVDLEGGAVEAGRVIDRNSILELLRGRGVEYVTYKDWRHIKAAEEMRGAERGAPRRKFCKVTQMLDVVEDGRKS